MKEQIWFANVKYLRLSTLHAHYTHVCIVSKVFGINTENKTCPPSKEYINGQWWLGINMVAKCIVHVHMLLSSKTTGLLVLLIYAVMLSYMQTAVVVQWYINMPYDRNICSGEYVNNVKCMYTSDCGHFVDCIEFIWCIYSNIVVSYVCMMWLAYVWHLRFIFIVATCMFIAWKIKLYFVSFAFFL